MGLFSGKSDSSSQGRSTNGNVRDESPTAEGRHAAIETPNMQAIRNLQAGRHMHEGTHRAE